MGAQILTLGPRTDATLESLMAYRRTCGLSISQSVGVYLSLADAVAIIHQLGATLPALSGEAIILPADDAEGLPALSIIWTSDPPAPDADKPGGRLRALVAWIANLWDSEAGR